jgi:small subunit ribosomal protein S18
MSEEGERRSKTSLRWQDFEKLRPYVTETGKILPRRITRLSTREQRHVARIVKQARDLLLCP